VSAPVKDFLSFFSYFLYWEMLLMVQAYYFIPQKKTYFLTNIPWLIGSLGTMVEDITIFIQFRVYSTQEGAPAPAVN